MTAAMKAVRTRKARQAFVNSYGETTAMVVRGLIRGQDEFDLMWETGIDQAQLAAYKANLHRGTYSAHLRHCNF